MHIKKPEFAQYIRNYHFRELFNDLGWNNDKARQPIIVDGQTFTLNGVAEKSGFKIMVCDPDNDGLIPDYCTRKKIETKVTKLFQEHLIIFTDQKRKEQVWQSVMRKAGKPSKLTYIRYFTHQDPELLYQKASGLLFELDEEENITILDVTGKVADNFYQNAEKVTRQFYERFRKEHISFYGFIKGIDDHIDDWNKKKKKGEPEQENKSKQWYVSLMLNRLMFCYFIQKKGFLDKNKNYLRDKLKECKAKKGKDKFYSFYRDFLLVLFHDGLNDPAQKEKIKNELGRIPYLNGGLFDEHELERDYTIDIDDKAFERIFDFFDEYEWHLDTREKATGKEINPDVIGFIFEKYINERAKMGAYYTKEDITDYISKNCIIPWLFDETQRQYPKAFLPDGEIWSALKESGDTYLYPAVKHGTAEDLPKSIAAGIKDVAKRTDWNKPAPASVALPTEIWREVVERRKRYEETVEKIKGGSFTQINDFITYNLNIREFAQDIIANTDDPELLKSFFKSLSKVTIIDPTCGSGAFLFAAMNILEPLYYTCITRMRGFTDDEDSENEKSKKKFSNKYKLFRDLLGKIQNDHHPNTEYFIYKSIILNNLYGVDIMKEAVEIAKLRLFLKLVATVEADYQKPNLGMEPLPDIDFNIRPGNTLIGFATKDELIKGGRYTLDFDKQMPKVEEECEIVAKAFTYYKEIQLSYGDDIKEFKKAKETLNKRLRKLNGELNKLLHKQADELKYEDWLDTHQPFHWFAEFYEIIHEKRGFDVIIGNPPYVEYSKVREEYKVKNLLTEKCGNLYPFIIEKVSKVHSTRGVKGFIIPLSGFCTQRMEPFVQFHKKEGRNHWVSHFGWRPATLFEGVNIPLSIVISSAELENTEISTTEFNKWYQEKRGLLNELLIYNSSNGLIKNQFVIPKIGREFNSIFRKVFECNSNLGRYVGKTKYCLFYRNTGGLYWRIILDFKPKFILNGVRGDSSTLTTLCFSNEKFMQLAIAILNSNLFWVYYVAYSSFHHVNPIDLTSFPVSFENMSPTKKEELQNLSLQLMNDMKLKSIFQTRLHKGGNNSQTQTFYPSQSKAIIDEIDKVLADYYGFSDDELDRIINYDIRFRLQTEEE